MNATANKQRIASEFVEREVYANVNQMVEFILSHESSEAPFSMDDVENMFTLPEYYGEYAKFAGGTEDQRGEEINRLDTLADEAYDNGDEEKEDAIRDEISELEGLEDEPQEILEWWLVSGWLAEKLQDAGEPVIMGENLWGRTTSGQAIHIDAVIIDICESLNLFK
jgi:hypothetical protein